eukprot:4025474-Prymnesium_polylepis.1
MAFWQTRYGILGPDCSPTKQPGPLVPISALSAQRRGSMVWLGRPPTLLLNRIEPSTAASDHARVPWSAALAAESSSSAAEDAPRPGSPPVPPPPLGTEDFVSVSVLGTVLLGFGLVLLAWLVVRARARQRGEALVPPAQKEKPPRLVHLSRDAMA